MMPLKGSEAHIKHKSTVTGIAKAIARNSMGKNGPGDIFSNSFYKVFSEFLNQVTRNGKRRARTIETNVSRRQTPSFENP